MNDWPNNLFYIVFLGQMFLISWILPRRLHARMQRLLTDYPPVRYPKLYPKPAEYYRFGASAYRLANQVIFALGFAMLYGAYALDGGSFSDDGYISEAWPMAYAVIQFLPLMALELLGFRQLKLMRETDTRRTRTASLRPRSLIESAPMMLVGLAALLLLAVIGTDLYLLDFRIAWGSDAVQRDTVLLAINLAFALMAGWHLHGQRRDPYLSDTDRLRQIRVQLSALLMTSCVLSLFFLTLIADDRFDLDFLDAPLMSLYFQVIALASIGFAIRSLRIEDVNFDVYRDDATRERTHA